VYIAYVNLSIQAVSALGGSAGCAGVNGVVAMSGECCVVRTSIIRAAAFLALLPGGVAYAQSVIGEREAVAQIEARLRSTCLPIPVGTRKTLPVAVMSDQELAVARSAIALEKAGVVTVTSVQNLAEHILTVTLRADFDKANLHPSASGPCLLHSAGVTVTKVTQREAAQGGTAVKWNAAIIFAFYDYQPNPYVVRYAQAMGSQEARDGLVKMKGAFLFRQDPFNQHWRLVTLDATGADGPLQVKFVNQALRGD
jgi:hypothetical protein